MTKITTTQVVEAHGMYVGERISLRNVGERYGISGEALRRRFIKHGLPLRKPGKPRPRALTPSQEGDVCDLYREGFGATFIAKQYGVSKAVIYYALRRRRGIVGQSVSNEAV